MGHFCETILFMSRNWGEGAHEPEGGVTPQASSIADPAIASNLDKRARALLEYLRNHAGEIVSKQALLEHVWPGQIIQENSLHQAVIRARKAVEQDGTQIEVVYGQGYRLLPPEGTAASEVTAPPSTKGRQRWLIAGGVTALLFATAGYGFFQSYWWPGETDDDRAEAAAVDYLSDDLLAKADPYAGKQYDPNVRPIVERVIADADKRFANEPAILAKLHFRFGSVLSGWGQYKRADFHMNRSAAIAERLYGRDSKDFVNVRTAQCETERLGGNLDAATANCTESIALARQIGDPVLIRRAQIAQAKLHFENGHYRDARALLQPIVSGKTALDDDTMANANWFYALSSRKLADFKAAESGFTNLLAIRKRQKGLEHPHTAWALSDYGDFLVDIGRYDEARKMLVEAERIFSATLGPTHPDTYSPRYSLALMDLQQGHADKAAEQFAALNKAFTKTLGADHLWTLYTRTLLALSLARSGRKNEARDMLDKVRSAAADPLYGKAEKLAYFEMCWAETLQALGDRSAAVKTANLARANQLRSLGATHPWMKRIDAVLAAGSIAPH